MDTNGFRRSTNVEDHQAYPFLRGAMAFFDVPYAEDLARNVRLLLTHPMTPVDQIGKVANTPGGLPEQAGVNDLQTIIDAYKTPTNGYADLPLTRQPFGSLAP